jgi:NADH:ubiquinone oxidoreductase subunit F (NADH-binding)
MVRNGSLRLARQKARHKSLRPGGKVKHTGLVEVPGGTTLREIVYDIGGGIENAKFESHPDRRPAGGCIPAQFLDTIVDFDSLTALGSMMGSGGMIIMDEDDCLVDIAKFFPDVSQDESCGKCTPCREGTKRMLEIIERITAAMVFLPIWSNLNGSDT